jgi:hypothetical protein
VRLRSLDCSHCNAALSETVDLLAMTHQGLATSTAPNMSNRG